MNLVGAFERSFFEFPNSFQKRQEKPQKSNRKMGVFTQNHVDKKMLDDQRFKFLRNLSKTQKFAIFLQGNDNDLSSNDFKYFLSRRLSINLTDKILNSNFRLSKHQLI
ncbi:Uncharacterized protein FWK35_00001589 [Aphis craccivora]|uniref:Uncharacterized protein n=1 Tax=Aphis craccivora TaxID=307492 RepID=A0A6G0ZDF5_APHCR|nr:Uncharacterized protein FWK35_00001589 [Aphis craccivora]